MSTPQETLNLKLLGFLESLAVTLENLGLAVSATDPETVGAHTQAVVRKAWEIRRQIAALRPPRQTISPDGTVHERPPIPTE